jgi:hypothetical protein
MKYHKKNKDQWQNQPALSEERTAITRIKSYSKMIGAFGVFANFFFYQAFLTGIYNYRNHELLNMRRIPFPLKLMLSSSISGFMVYKLYNDQLYDEDLYKVALKYREEYDSEYVNFEKVQNAFNIGQAGSEK